MDWRNKWVAGAVLLLVLTVLSTIGYIRHLRAELAAAESATTTLALEKEGLERALAVRPREVTKFVRVPLVVEKLIKEGKTEPLLATKIETKTERVDVPIPTCTDPAPVGDGQTPKTDNTLPIDLGLQGELFMTWTYPEAVHVTGRLTARLSSNGWHKLVSFTPEDTDIQTRVSQDILDALKRDRDRPSRFALLPRPVRHWRTGWAVGVGGGYDPLDGQVRPVAAAIYSIQM